MADGTDDAREKVLWGRMARLPLFVATGRELRPWDWDGHDRRVILDHLEWALALEEAGHLIGSGPLTDRAPGTNNLHGEGLSVLAGESREKVEELLAADPLVRAGMRRYEVRSWLLNEGLARALAPTVAGTRAPEGEDGDAVRG